MLPYLKLSCFLFALSLPIATQAQSEESSGQESSNLFSLEADQVGLFQNSVNLFTGQVAFSLPLATLPGRGGMSASVALSYSSAGIEQQTRTWNLDAPTSTVGLGWQLDIPRVVVDNKQTGTRTDDKFYLVEGGVSHPLVVTEIDQGVRTLVSENYKFWNIEYEEATETWTITKENGTQYIYGDKDSERSTVQYLVKWGNWIGSSSVRNGQQQQAMQWDLSEIRNLFRDAVTFTYEQETQQVGAGGLEHTEASYLTKITNPQGQSVTLVYEDKTSSDKLGVIEYQEPHTEALEPDAYQERYEKRYLDHLVVRNREHTSDYRYSIHLGYAIVGLKDLAKRILTSIERRDAQKIRHVPPIEFAYYPTGGRAGKMMLATTSQGPQIEYEYTGVIVQESERQLIVEAPEGGYSEPQTWIGNNYVVVAWRQLAADGKSHQGSGRKLKLTVYQWAGRWIKGPEEEIEDTETKDWRLKNIEVALGKDFFGFKYYHLASNNWKVKLYHQTGLKTGDWKVATKGIRGNDGRVFVGSNFVALATKIPGNSEKSQLKAFTWNGRDWRESLLHDQNGDFAYTVANNFIIAHDNDPNPDEIFFHYLDERQQWQQGTVPDEIRFTSGKDKDDNGTGRSEWHSSNSFAIGMVDSHQGFGYMWDEDYTLNRVTRRFIAEDNRDPVHITGSANVGIHRGRERAWIAFYRYNGSEWSDRAPINYSDADVYLRGDIHTSFSGDHLLRTFPLKDLKKDGATIEWYNPNDHSWNTQSLGDIDYPYLNVNTNGRYAHFTGQYFYRQTDGAWKKIAYEDDFGSDQPDPQWQSNGGMTAYRTYAGFTRVIVPRNGNIEDANRHQLFSGIFAKHAPDTWSSQFVGSGIVITYQKYATSESLYDSRKLFLHKLVDEKFGSRQLTYPATKVTVHNGYQELPTTYAYTTGTATMSPGGSTAQFNEVKVVPGSVFSKQTPYGYLKHYFFNGLSSEESSLAFPEDKFIAIHAHNHYQKLLGMPYTVQTYDHEENLVSESKTKWHIYAKSITPEGENNPVAVGRYARVNESTQQQDGLSQTVTYFYDQDGTGQPNLTISKDSQGRQYITTNRYATDYEDDTYGSDLLRDRDISSPVLEQTVDLNGEILSKSETHYELQHGQPLPTKSITYPTGGNRSITSLMIYDDYGNLVQTQTEGGVISATLYGYDYTLPVVEAVGANYDQLVSQVSLESIQNKDGSALRSDLDAVRTGIPNAFITTRTYDWLYGPTSETDPRGRTTYTYYDEQGRLHYVTDNEQYVRRKVEYNAYKE